MVAVLARRAAVAVAGTIALGTWSRREPIARPSLMLNTGARIPAIGFGTYLSNGDELFGALLVAIRTGYRHLDTAAGYANENVVAAAITESGRPREEFFITTKLWCDSHGTERTQKAIAKSLRRLQTPYIDLYLVHAPDNQGTSPTEIRRLRRESWLVMEDAYRAGSLRAIGVSNFEPRHIDDLLRNEDGTPRKGAVVPAVNQIEMHPFLDQANVRAYCQRMGIVVEAYGSVNADGLLEHPSVTQLARRYQRSPAQICLRYTWQRRGAVVLAKSVTPARIRENAQIFDFSLADADCAMLDALAKNERSYWDNSDVP